MNKKPNGNEPLFPGLRVPEPPEDLRRQVLSRAAEALGKEPRRDLWARLWESRQARLAWAASVLALAVGHLALPAGNGGTVVETGPASGQPTLARTLPDDQDELSVIADLPRLSFDARPVAASDRTRGENEVDLDGAAPPAPPEENAS